MKIFIKHLKLFLPLLAKRGSDDTPTSQTKKKKFHVEETSDVRRQFWRMDFYSREKLDVFWDVWKFLRFKVLKKKVRLLKECGDVRLSR